MECYASANIPFYQKSIRPAIAFFSLMPDLGDCRYLNWIINSGSDGLKIKCTKDDKKFDNLGICICLGEL
jgi:hypothetical protein